MDILILSLPAWLVIGNLSEQAGFTLKKWNGLFEPISFLEKKKKSFPQVIYKPIGDD
ncbi:MAG: hypothetical protein AAF551_02080 [Bacteroidota bacterium]